MHCYYTKKLIAGMCGLILSTHVWALTQVDAAAQANALGQSHHSVMLDHILNFKPSEVIENYVGDESVLDTAEHTDYLRFIEDMLKASARHVQSHAVDDLNLMPEISTWDLGFCHDGGCVSDAYERSTAFTRVASVLSVMDEAVSQVDGTNPRLFEGKAMSCQQDSYHYIDCCKERGWGKDFKLTHCSAHERALAEYKTSGRAIYVGKYCSHKNSKLLGKACDKHKRVYCVFDTQLGSIIQSQGREGQLKKGFGEAKTPNCRGLTIDEFQALNFDRIRFDAYYDTINQAAAPLLKAVLTRSIQGLVYE